MKKAFTMLELVMVIIVLGIIASIGADIIVSLYDNYIRTRTINILESKTEITLEQIAKRFQYRIKSSTIARRTGVGAGIISVSDPLLNNSYPIIEWIGYSNESFLGTPRPGWSGFIDMYHSDTNSSSQTFKTTDSNLTLAANIMAALTNGNINLTAGQEAALIFKKPWNFSDFGWGVIANADGNATVKVRRLNDEVLALSNDTNLTEIYEQYYLAHTAYAIVPEGDIAGEDFNLTLYYNYQPWMGDIYNFNGANFPLVEHVNLFHFRQDQTLLRFKLCIHDNNESGIGERVVVCKEKVVY